MAEYIERGSAMRTAHILRPEDKELMSAISIIPAVSVPQWISTEEKLPRNYTEVVVFDAINRDILLGGIGSSGEWEVHGRRTDDLNITHWMPLPEAPKGENDG